MRFFNVNLISFVLIIGILSGLATDASAKRKKLLKKKEDTTLVVPKPKENKDSVEYHKLIKDAVTREGLLTTHFTPQKKLYWEIPDSAFAHTYLLSNRIAATSNTQDFVAGQMATQPILLQLSCDSINVYLHKVQTQNSVDENESIAAAFDKNFLNPVLKAFKIEARNKGNVVIDVTSFFGGNEKCISPIKPSNPLAKLFGGDSGIKGSFVSNASSVYEVKTFPRNIEIKSSLTFNTSPMDEPYTVQMHRSFIVLPDEPMPMRLQDNRVGYFYSDRSHYTTEKDKVDEYTFIHRWRLEPKPEDRERYFAGELVEPQKPIIFYVDSAFPDKWRDVVKQGIEDWNTAFEAAGFKNAIQARDYPKNDPDFDPDDMRYSCVKYAATTIANAMGPSFVDPRSGEILTADVIWYHNIVSLLHNWRFCQTAATDPRVRKTVFDDEVMRESMRYVASHEIGHTLGLMHNMGASFAYPVDSLRSPSFTQKYGTTPSIMDYARNNYVAQPGDYERGVKLTPPVLGVYDIYAIAWGYRLIPGADTPLEEKPTLNRWIVEKMGDPMYEFGAQQFMAIIDPTDQTEDLSNDHLRAGDYAISNLKIIMANLEKWAAEPGEPYDDLDETYDQLVKQYTRHIGHVMTYIGGVEFKDARQGNKNAARTHLDRATQKKAMQWLMRQARTYNDWLTPAPLMMKLDRNLNCNDKLASSIVGSLLNSTALYRIDESGQVNARKNYTLETYLDDALYELFKASYQGKRLNDTERRIQSSALAVMVKYSGLTPASGKKSASAKALADYSDVMALGYSPDVPCSHAACQAQREEEVSFLRINMGQPGITNTRIAPVMTAHLKKIEALYKQQRARTGDKTTRDFYDYQLLQIQELFN